MSETIMVRQLMHKNKYDDENVFRSKILCFRSQIDQFEQLMTDGEACVVLKMIVSQI